MSLVEQLVAHTQELRHAGFGHSADTLEQAADRIEYLEEFVAEVKIEALMSLKAERDDLRRQLVDAEKAKDLLAGLLLKAMEQRDASAERVRLRVAVVKAARALHHYLRHEGLEGPVGEALEDTLLKAVDALDAHEKEQADGM